MSTFLIGQREDFAIELELLKVWPPYGYVRLWLGGIYLGDIREAMFLYGLWCSLRAMHPRGNKYNMYTASEEVPSYQTLWSRGGWSFGEGFDDFHLVYYAIENEGFVHFHWKLGVRPFRDHGEYPSGLHHYAIRFETFAAVVDEFTRVTHFDVPPQTGGEKGV